MRNKLNLPKYEPQGRDGSYQWGKREQEKEAKELEEKFRKALENAKKTLKPRPVSITETKGNLYLQFSTQTQYDGSKGETIRSKYSVAQYLGTSKCASTPDAVNSALQIALQVAKELESGTFSWDNYVCWIKGNVPEHLKQQTAKRKTCKELIDEYREHYYATHDFSTEEKARKSERGWRNNYRTIFSKLPQDKPLNLAAIKSVLSSYNPSKITYKTAISRINSLCEYHSIKIDFKQFEYRGEIEIRKGRELSEQEIIKGWENIKYYHPRCGRKSKYHDLFAWMYGMMAVYGLRNHETLNIQNLTQPYKIPNENVILPAFNDPCNAQKAIYTYGKTGERVQPYPSPIKWIELFDLTNIPSFPIFKTLKQKDYLVKRFVDYCAGNDKNRTTKKIDFRLYDLRHSYAMRCRKDNINPLDSKDYMGHSLETHEKIYNEGYTHRSKIEGAAKYQQQKLEQKPELSEIELLRLENEQLKATIQQLLESIKK